MKAKQLISRFQLPNWVGVVGDAPRHPVHPDPVHRDEGAPGADQGAPEVDAAELLVVHPPGHLREPVVDAGEDREDRAAEEDEVDVGDDEVGVGDVDVDRHHAQHHAADAADREGDDEGEREQHRRRVGVDLAEVERAQPGEDLDPGRHRDQQRGDHHRHPQPAEHAGDEHVVRPDRVAEDDDPDQRQRHQPVAEDRLAGVGRDDLAR